VEVLDCGLVVDFDLPFNGTVGMQIGISYLIVEKARDNLTK